MTTRAALLRALDKQSLWHACWTIHHANHLRPKGEVKVGGHQASSASMVSIMMALYFNALRPEDPVAVKPRASPVPRHPISDRQPDAREAGEFPRLRGCAVLSEPDQGRR